MRLASMQTVASDCLREMKQVKGTCQSKDVYRGKNKAETGRIEEH